MNADFADPKEGGRRFQRESTSRFLKWMGTRLLAKFAKVRERLLHESVLCALWRAKGLSTNNFPSFVFARIAKRAEGERPPRDDGSLAMNGCYVIDFAASRE